MDLLVDTKYAAEAPALVKSFNSLAVMLKDMVAMSETLKQQNEDSEHRIAALEQQLRAALAENTELRDLKTFRDTVATQMEFSVKNNALRGEALALKRAAYRGKSQAADVLTSVQAQLSAKAAELSTMAEEHQRHDAARDAAVSHLQAELDSVKAELTAERDAAATLGAKLAHEAERAAGAEAEAASMAGQLQAAKAAEVDAEAMAQLRKEQDAMKNENTQLRIKYRRLAERFKQARNGVSTPR